VVKLEFNNEIIDGQSTVAENLAKSNRNFMLLKEILGSGATSQDIQSMLDTISQTYVKTTDIVNNLNSTDTNKPVSALQAKNLKGELTKLNQNITKITELLSNKVDKVIHLPNNTDFNTINQPGQYAISVGGVNAPVSYDESIPTHWDVNVYWGNPNNNVFYQVAQTIKEPNKIFKRHCINKTFSAWSTFSAEFDKTVYKKLQDVQGTNVDILAFAKNLKASGYFQLFYQNKNVPPTGNWDWAYSELIYQNDNAIHLKLTTLFPPYSVATIHYINGSWQSWVVV
jgi:hypothetical protein